MWVFYLLIPIGVIAVYALLSCLRNSNKCWWWAHEWDERQQDRVEHFRFVYLRKYHDKIYYRRKCKKCDSFIEEVEDEYWWG